MKFLDTKFHGYLDYTIGILLLFIPSVMHLEAHTAQSLIFYIFGIFTLFLALHTDYEAGLYKLLPVEVHVVIEVVTGLFFALSPWIFGFAGKVFFPHLFFGVMTIVLSLGTKTQDNSLSRF